MNNPNIELISLEDRGVHPDSFFEVEFEKDVIVTEHSMNWSDISTLKKLKYPDGRTRDFYVSDLPILRLKVSHLSLESELFVDVNSFAYQAICERLTYSSDGKHTRDCIGRIFGVVDSNYNVLNEIFLDGKMNEVIGLNYENTG